MKHSLRIKALLLALAASQAYAAPARTSISSTKPAPVKAHINTARVAALIAKMTLEEKLALIHGQQEPAATYQGQAGWIAGVPRLGIPPLRLADGPHGVLTRLESGAPPATLALAATFSASDAHDLGAAVGRNARAHGVHIVLQPYINIMRDYNFPRANNVYGEDPLLTGAMGAGFIKGAQAQGVMAQAKHYIAYEGPTDVHVNEQALHEIYVAPFRDAVNAGVSSIMCSYNKLNGTYACGNAQGLTKILKGELGFKGFVTSDWGANHGAEFIGAGLDMDMPGDMGPPMNSFIPPYFANIDATPPAKLDLSLFLPSGDIPEEMGTKSFPFNSEKLAPGYTATFKTALPKGSVNMRMIDDAAARVLGQMERFGYLDGHNKQDISQEPVEENARVFARVALHSAVLLKNDGVLPLTPATLKDTLFVGAGARQNLAVVYAGERAHGYVNRQIGVVQALKEATGSAIAFAVGEDLAGTAIPAAAFEGLKRTQDKVTTPDTQISYTLTDKNALPAGSHATWTGNLKIDTAGDYDLSLHILGASAKLKIDGKTIGSTSGLALHGDVLHPNQDDILPSPDGLDSVRRRVHLEAGSHSLEVAVDSDSSKTPVQIRLAWVTPQARAANRAEAIAEAKKAKTAVVFAWNRGKPDAMSLPGDQDAFITDIAATNPNTIVILNTAGPVHMPWLDKVKGVVEIWYSGDEGGRALADILTGNASPAGRLPFTWPRTLSDMPANDPKYPERSLNGVNGVSRYSEGIFMGYRWFDKENKAPLYPFGYGLSYSRFSYSHLKLTRAAHGAWNASFSVKNEGDTASDDVPQLYLGAPRTPLKDVQFAKNALVGFTRVSLKPHEARQVHIQMERRRFEYWSTHHHKWVYLAKTRTLSLGASSRDFRVKVQLP
jgi:beta-glucosidase